MLPWLVVTFPDTQESGLGMKGWEVKIIVLCPRSDYQRDDLASTHRLGRASTRQYLPLLTTTSTCAQSVFLEGNGHIFYGIYPTYALFKHYYWRSVLISTIFSTKMRSHQRNVNISFQYHNLDCKTLIHNRKV